jgi:tetratricopeptide (TPR) repeat protein
MHLAYALYLAEDWEGAQRVAARAATADSTGWYAQALLARIAARRGNTATAVRLSKRLALVRQPYLFGRVTLARSEIASLLGERDQAVALLQQALSEGFPFVYEVHIDPDFEPLHGYLPFEEVLRPRG